MLGLVAALLFSGYLLVYAAVAHAGAFAKEPWRGLYEDAYSASAGSSNPGGVVGVLGKIVKFLHDDPSSVLGRLLGGLFGKLG